MTLLSCYRLCVFSLLCAFNATSRRIDARPSLELKILAYQRPLALKRLLDSLLAAQYPSDAQVSLSVLIDRNPDSRQAQTIAVQDTIALAEKFTWPHGPFTVVVAPQHRGIFGSWLAAVTKDGFTGGIGDSNVLILEDDTVVGPLFCVYLLAAWRQYRSLPYVAGISLQRHWGLTDRNAISREPFLSRVPGPWGFSPHLAIWSDFVAWAQQHPKLDQGIPELQLSTWYHNDVKRGHHGSMWTFHFAVFCAIRNLKILFAPGSLYDSLGQAQALVASNRDVGEHFGSNVGLDAPLYVGTNLTAIANFPFQPRQAAWDIERFAL